MNLSKLLQHPSSRPSGHGITLGTPRFYALSAPLLFGDQLHAAPVSDMTLRSRLGAQGSQLPSGELDGVTRLAVDVRRN